MEEGLRSNTLASSNETRSSPIFLALSAFLPHARVEAYIRASKSVQKRSKPFLAVIVTTNSEGGEVDAWLYVVRKTEGKQPFQIKTKFEISKLRLVNGLSEEDDNLEFELTFEKGNTISGVRWRAETVHKKKHLLISLWKVINENKKTPPQFLNINYSLLQDSLILSLKLKQAGTSSPAPDLALEYKYLTTEEERDLGKVTEGTDWVAENANKFMKKLTNELSGLDKANIHSIMSVENEVTRLFYMMDNAMEELCRVESLLLQYQTQLHRDRKSVEGTLMCYRDRETRNKNTKLLLDEAEQLLDQITFSPASEDDLKNQPLDSISQITRCTNAVLEIQEKLSMSRTPLLDNLACVKEQTQLMEGLLYSFSLRVIDTVSKLTDPSWSAAPAARHAKLLPFQQLMQWLCTYNMRVFNDILKEYEVSSQKIYEKLIKEYFDLKRSDVNKIKSTEKILFSSKKDVSGKMKASSTSLAVKGSSSSLGLKGSLASVKGSTTSLDSVQSSDSFHTGSNHQMDKYSASVRDTLDFIEQTVLKEEEFLVKLFGFKSEQPVDLTGVIGFVLTKLPTDLLSFVELSYKQDIYHALPLFLYIAERYDEVDKCSYLEDILKRARGPAHKNFLNLFQVQCNKVIEQSRKSHRGTADSVLHFTKFIKYSEAFQRRRAELDEAYTQLCGAVESAIERLAEQSKVPPDVLLLENYHYLYMFLLKNKVESLDKFRKQCHQKYNKHLTLYVEAHLGTPLERLSLFFDSVNSKLKSGVPPDEIGFTPALSKQELRALTVHYTAKEVRKGLEATMKKVEKHFTKEQNLFQVTCLSMQAEFIKQVEGYQDLMQQCYPGSGLRLEFTVSHINDIFNAISKNKAS